MTFDKSMTEGDLNERLNNIPGVIEHGLFYQLASAVFIAHDGNIEEKWR